MTIRSKPWVRKHDVYHLEISAHASIKRFERLVGFRNKLKVQRSKVLVTMMGMPCDKRYVWFKAHYQEEGRRWVRIKNLG